MLGFLSSWKGQRHIPFRPARIPKCPAACRVVTDCFTTSNTFNRQVLPEIRKAPVILTRKMASAGFGFHIHFSHGKGAASLPRLGEWCSVFCFWLDKVSRGDSYLQCINYSVSSSNQLYDKRFNIDVFEILNDWMSFISDVNPSSEIPIKTTN